MMTVKTKDIFCIIVARVTPKYLIVAAAILNPTMKTSPRAIVNGNQPVNSYPVILAGVKSKLIPPAIAQVQ